MEALRAKLAATVREAASVPDWRAVMARAAEAEREARVAHLQRQAVSRLKNQKLIAAWGTWSDKYAEWKRQTSLLAGAAGRMRHPRLLASLEHWHG